ncbi:MAG: YqgE/AlgH family protein [Mariprofundaceae bacterium]|nr:YqgE/AlgH family protein [Mariprofundaceae bacterium]
MQLDFIKANDLNGKLLLATPSLQEQAFKDSVILLCHHDDEGSMGLIINRPQELTIRDVLEEIQLPPRQEGLDSLSEKRLTTYEGGPIDSFRGFVLHDAWHMYESTMQITSELHLTTSRDVLECISRGADPEHFMLILGYAAWSSGQLEQELMDNDWLIVDSNEQLVFQAEPEHRWVLGAQSMGIHKSHLSSLVGHA